MKQVTLMVYVEVPDDYTFDENPIWNLEDAMTNPDSECDILEVYIPREYILQ